MELVSYTLNYGTAVPRVSRCRYRTYVLITLSRSPQSPPDVQMVSSLFTHPTSLHFFLFTGVIGTACPCPACLQSSVRLPNRFIAFRDPPPSILLAEKVLTPYTAPRYLLHQFILVIPQSTDRPHTSFSER
jgi:hypothetical protein